MGFKIINELILPCYIKKLEEILCYIKPAMSFDINNIKWVLYSTYRSLNNNSICTELFGKITGSDIAYCDINSNTIYITNYTLKQADSFIIEVILHEIAHIKSSKSNHESEFVDCFNNLVQYYNKRTKGAQVLNEVLLYEKKGIFEK